MKISNRYLTRFITPSILLTASVLISGCTTIQPAQQCTPAEKVRLASNVKTTKAKLEQTKSQLARTQTQMSRQSCLSGINSAACIRIKSRADKLKSDIKILELQLAELNATIAGKSHTGKFVQACTATWIPVRKQQKTAPKKAAVNKSAKNSGEPATYVVTHPVEDVVVPGYQEMPKPTYTSISHEPLKQTDYRSPASISPASSNPASSTPSAATSQSATTTPVERDYSQSSKVRVVGSSFLEDQSKPVGPQAPDREAAQ